MALFIISRRPGEAEFSYRNRLTAENVEVNGHSGAGRRLAYERLRIRVETMMMRWRGCEPETEFRLMDTGVEHDDRFEQPKAREDAKKTRIVLPDGNGKDYDTVLQHRVGDPVTWENTASRPGRGDGFNGYVVVDRRVERDTVFLFLGSPS